MVDPLFRRCASLFMVGFEGTTAPDSMRTLIDDGVYGAILFKRNVESPAQTASLINELKKHAGRPLVMAVDQEGGRVARLRGAPFTALPPMREIGKSRDPALAYRVGQLLGYELRSVGFDWDFAPVLDVDTNPNNPVIGDRALHREPDEVARLGVAMGQGLEAAGVASCGKHFPGHGDTEKDSHLDLPRLPHDLKRLRDVELKPFAAWAKAKLAAVMTAHVVFDALEPGKPATMSQKAMGLLRHELGFNGVLVSDDLEMKAIAEHFSVEQAVVEGVNAGVDLFLVCHKEQVQRAAIEALAKAVRERRVPEARLQEAIDRVAALASKFAQPALTSPLLSRLGSAEHQVLAQGLSSDFRGVDPTERALA